MPIWKILSNATTTKNVCIRRWGIAPPEEFEQAQNQDITLKVATLTYDFGRAITERLGTGTQTPSLPQTLTPVHLRPSRYNSSASDTWPYSPVADSPNAFLMSGLSTAAKQSHAKHQYA
jgi:hypothetical protein